jgi:hypothetical protein
VGVTNAIELMKTWLRARLKLEGEKEMGVEHERRYFTTATFELGQTAALSWYLSEKDKYKIESAIQGKGGSTGPKRPGEATDVPSTIEKVLKWWDSTVLWEGPTE